MRSEYYETEENCLKHLTLQAGLKGELSELSFELLLNCLTIKGLNSDVINWKILLKFDKKLNFSQLITLSCNSLMGRREYPGIRKVNSINIDKTFQKWNSHVILQKIYKKIAKRWKKITETQWMDIWW